jgi:hypothetical protein
VGRARGDRGRGNDSRKAWACLGGACIVTVGACQKDPVITDRAVTLHAPKTCATGLPDLDASAYAVYHALGDYEPGAQSDGHVLMSVGTALPEIGPAARALLVDATGAADRVWEGTTPIAGSGPVDVLVLPSTTPCALRGPVPQTEGATIGISGSQRVLIIGGPGAPVGTPEAASFHLDTGEVDALSIPGGARTGATLTAFGAGALLAGGKSASGVRHDAIVYDPALDAFESLPSQSIQLSVPREDAGAVVLATGETLLVGGAGGDGTTLLDTMEIIDPVTRKVRTAGARLATARRAPTVLRLASGEVFVAGGRDATGTSVAKLEWFSPDVSQATLPAETLVEAPYASVRTYVALQAGGVLAVFAPTPIAPSTFQNTWVVDPNGLPEAATPVEGTLAAPVLFDGAGGAPVLWTGPSAGPPPGAVDDAGAARPPGRWLQWQPWTGAWSALDVLDDTPGRVVGAAASPDPGMALWLDVTNPLAPKLDALRFDVRGEYSTLPGPLLLTDANDVAPDRLSTDGMVSFDPGQGLILMPGASAGEKGGSAFVTDRTYADVRIEVDAPTGQPALVVLRDELGQEMEVDNAACFGAVVQGAASSLTIERKGTSLTWALAGAASGASSGACTLGFASDARVVVGVRASPGIARSVARNLRVTRLGTP